MVRRADFETMIGQLVRRLNGQARTVAPNPGDWGIDVVVGHLNDAIDVWQSKYFRPVVAHVPEFNRDPGSLLLADLPVVPPL